MNDITDPLHVAAVKRQVSGVKRLFPPGLRPTRWVTTRPVSYCGVNIPAGFSFDGATIPFGLTALLPRAHSDYLAAALVHDWLYAHGQTTRKAADAIFHKALIDLQVSRPLACAMWVAVRIGGGAYWYPRRGQSFSVHLFRKLIPRSPCR